MIRPWTEVPFPLRRYDDDAAMRIVLPGDVMLGRVVNRHLAEGLSEGSPLDISELFKIIVSVA
jgi:hypothetical protein